MLGSSVPSELKEWLSPCVSSSWIYAAPEMLANMLAFQFACLLGEGLLILQ